MKEIAKLNCFNTEITFLLNYANFIWVYILLQVSFKMLKQILLEIFSLRWVRYQRGVRRLAFGDHKEYCVFWDTISGKQTEKNKSWVSVISVDLTDSRWQGLRITWSVLRNQAYKGSKIYIPLANMDRVHRRQLALINAHRGNFLPE